MALSERLILTAAQQRQILDHAVQGRPYEVCGLISGWQGIANSILPIANIAAAPRTRYLLDPAAFVAAYTQIERSGDELIGIYHSHPMGVPIPSTTDIAEATWPDVVYLIVGFVADTPQMAVWSIRRGKVTPVKLAIK